MLFAGRRYADESDGGWWQRWWWFDVSERVSVFADAIEIVFGAYCRQILQ